MSVSFVPVDEKISKDARTTKCHSQRLTLDFCCAFVPCNWCANSGAATRMIFGPKWWPPRSSAGRSGELQMQLMQLASYTYLFVVFARLAVWTIGVLLKRLLWAGWTKCRSICKPACVLFGMLQYSWVEWHQQVPKLHWTFICFQHV